MEQLLDDAGTWACSNMKGIQISRISDEAIEAITTHFAQRTSDV
jgi:hypothetical protein